MFYELNDALIVFWNLGQTSETKSRINREKNGRKEQSSIAFKIWIVQKGGDISRDFTKMPKKRINEKTATADKSIRIRKKFLSASKRSGKYPLKASMKYQTFLRKQHGILKMN